LLVVKRPAWPEDEWGRWWKPRWIKNVCHNSRFGFDKKTWKRKIRKPWRELLIQKINWWIKLGWIKINIPNNHVQPK
jgi:hypothetical protein